MVTFIVKNKKIIAVVIIIAFVFFMSHLVLNQLAFQNTYSTESITNDFQITPFPIGVNPATKTISESLDIDSYVSTHITRNHTAPLRAHSFTALLRVKLEQFTWYQQFATPRKRVAIIWSGERHEQVAKHFRQLFGWDNTETEHFTSLVQENITDLNEGMFFPGRYIFDLPTSPELVALTINQRFTSEVHLRYTPEISEIVPLSDTLIIASLIEREAFDFEDMRVISGIIWNRLFIDMPLQIDATLQYVKGVPGSNRHWWPIPRPSDKFLESPFNTYKNIGLPPEPIANPSIEAIVAALNPKETSCLFYFHTNNGEFYCSETYKEHVALIKQKL
jgi:cell division protein YceG involved in septum cleavage